VLDDAADEVQGGVGQAGIAFASEGVLAIFPMDM
jgi:acetylornithine/succinyldiaminopimelate/putrescine aminotransferase